MSMGSAPKPPDPYKTASAQGAANREAAVASSIIGNVNENNPYGSVNYKRLADEYTTDASGKQVAVPRYERNVTLSPEQQELLNYQNQMQSNLGQLGVSQSNRLQGLLGTNLDTEGLPAWQSYQQAKPMQTTFDDVGGVKRSIGDLGGIQNSFGANNPLAMTVGDGGQIRQDQGATDRNAIEQAMLSRYREQSGKDRAAEDARLAAQGLTQGSGRYGSVAQQRGQQDVDAYNQAYLASGAESRAAQDAYNQAQNQRFQQGYQQAGFANEAQAQAYQQAAERAAFANDAQSQRYGQYANNASFANDAQQQAYQQAMERAGFANDAQAQAYQQAMERAELVEHERLHRRLERPARAAAAGAPDHPQRPDQRDLGADGRIPGHRAAIPGLQLAIGQRRTDRRLHQPELPSAAQQLPEQDERSLWPGRRPAQHVQIRSLSHVWTDADGTDGRNASGRRAGSAACSDGRYGRYDGAPDAKRLSAASYGANGPRWPGRANGWHGSAPDARHDDVPPGWRGYEVSHGRMGQEIEPR
jgi:hypothetical protein